MCFFDVDCTVLVLQCTIKSICDQYNCHRNSRSMLKFNCHMPQDVYTVDVFSNNWLQMCTFTDETPRQSTSPDVMCCQAICLLVIYFVIHRFVHFLLIMVMSHHVFISTHYPHRRTLWNNSNMWMNVNLFIWGHYWYEKQE